MIAGIVLLSVPVLAKRMLLPVAGFAVLEFAAPLQAQQYNAESTDIQRQLEQLRWKVEQTSRRDKEREPILPQEAKDHVGENASVRGLVEQVSFSHKGHAFLNFGGWYPRHVFTGFIRAEDVDRIGGQTFLRALVGGPVTVSGRIQLYRGKPEIAISALGQIRKESVLGN
jgi:hypothetical protein